MSSKSKKPKKTVKASVLKYNKNIDNAPVYLGTGKGIVAERIIRLARENKVQIMANPELIGFLEKLPPGSEIPPDLYVIVAEIFAFCFRLKQENNLF